LKTEQEWQDEIDAEKEKRVVIRLNAVLARFLWCKNISVVGGQIIGKRKHC
jgi:hypothetical protein